ncbi:hypothetical protein OH77DRAFT_1476721 [Trametes cingulata]|nr:hypothetical protein OH77DRAFT_1476721 [Trametes cingulata]
MEPLTPMLNMEAVDFANRFFPVPSSVSRPSWASITFEDCGLGDNPPGFRGAERLMRIVNTNNVAPGYKLSALSDKPAMEVEGADELEVHAFDSAFVKIPGNSTFESLRWIDQMVSVKFTPQADPFGSGDDTQAAERSQARKEIIASAEQIFRVQHRTALFMLLVIGRHFRFIRWDRSGAIVTPAVDYVAQPGTLCNIIWQMAKQSDEQLGLDPSATRLHPGDEDYQLMDEYAIERATDLASHECMLPEHPLWTEPIDFEHVRLSFRASLRHRWPRYRLEVPSGSKTRFFLVGKPMSYNDRMVGRGSRGYVALDVETNEFVWLKDTWRVHDELPTPEGSTLSRLNEKDVRSVPTLVCHGDIPNQTTLSPRLWEERNPSKSSDGPSPSPSPALPLRGSSPSFGVPQSSPTSHKRTHSEYEYHDTPLSFCQDCPFRRRKHYRMVVEEVGMPLSELENGRQLVKVVLGCLHAHEDAVTKAGILHRDISEGNLIILPMLSHDAETNSIWVVRRGLLVDWESSIVINDLKEEQRPRKRPNLVGTWQSQSVGMLTGETNVPGISDELESFFHVLLWSAVLYLRSNCPDYDAFLDRFFDAADRDKHGFLTCGSVKRRAVMELGYLEVDVCAGVRLTFRTPLDDIFQELLRCFRARYKVQRWRKMQMQTTRPIRDADQSSPSPPMSSQDLPPTRRPECGPEEESERVCDVESNGRTSPYMPTPEEEQYATYVASHEYMACVLATEVMEGRWGFDAKVRRVRPPWEQV